MVTVAEQIQASRGETIQTSAGTFTRGEIEKVELDIQRSARGKTGSLLFGEPRLVALREALIRESPELTSILRRGVFFFERRGVAPRVEEELETRRPSLQEILAPPKLPFFTPTAPAPSPTAPPRFTLQQILRPPELPFDIPSAPEPTAEVRERPSVLKVPPLTEFLGRRFVEPTVPAVVEFVVTEPKPLAEVSEIFERGKADLQEGRGPDPLQFFRGTAELTKTAVLAPFTVPAKGFEQAPGVVGFPFRVGAELIPETPLEAGVFFGGLRVFKALPRLGQKVFAGGIGAISVPATFDPGLTAEERVAAGTITVAGGLGTVFPTKFQLGTKAQRAQLKLLVKKGLVTEETGVALLEGIKLQRFLRGQRDIPTQLGVKEIIPPELKPKEATIVERFLREKDPLLFGGKALEIRGVRKGSDIDIAIKENERALKNLVGQLRRVGEPKEIAKRGEAIGIRGEKLLDIKEIQRVEEFPLAQEPVITEEGLKVTKVSEQFARALSGTLELRKGGKDIKDVLLASEAILKQSIQVFEETGFQPLKALRGARLKRALGRFEVLRGVAPEFRKVTFEGKPLEVPRVRGLEIEFDVREILAIRGKRGEVIPPSRTDLGVRDILRLDRRRAPRLEPIGRGVSEITPSDISASLIAPSFITPSVFVTDFAPSRIKVPKVKEPVPSAFIPKISTPLEPSVFIPRVGEPLIPFLPPPPTPSEFKTPTIGIGIPPPPSRPPPIPPLKPPKKPPTPPKKKRKEALRSLQGFNTLVKSKGRFRRTNKKPQRLQNALSEGAFLTDHSTSRQFKVKKSKTRIRKPKQVDPYFQQNRFKFREFKQKGKRRQITPLNFIERTNFAIDTPNEVKGIPLSGVLAQQRQRVRRQRAGLPPKKRKIRRTPRTPRLSFTDL